MRELMVLLAMTMGFGLGNLLGSKGNDIAKLSFDEFVSQVQNVQALNDQQLEFSSERQELLDLPADVDPNLFRHQ